MRTHRWAALAVWALLGWGMAARGGFAFSFLFYSYSFIVAYGWAVRWIGLRGVRVTRAVRCPDGAAPPDGAFEAGEEAIVEVTLRRPFALPIPWLVARERIGEAEHDLLHGPWWSTRATYRYALPLPSRGVFAFEPTELWAGDPFGIVQQRVRARGTAIPEVIVAPRARRFGYEVEHAILSLGDGRAAGLRRDGGERTDVRAYRDGDSLARVLWKRAARSDEWYVRTEEPPRAATETAVVVDAAVAAATDDCAEAAAGVLVALGVRRRTFRLYAAAVAAGNAGGWRRRLAALEVAAPPIRAGAATLGGASGVVVVAGGALRPETAALCREWQTGGRDVLLLLARGEPGVRPGDAELPEELASWLRRAGVRIAVTDAAGDRIAAEGGGRDDDGRFSVPS
ncbi:DUF58 domain-containing protein [Paenibacillus sp.]|uniref:DUF58 domain-containing protein n=1 Tax=Paenibacillus sp. TaxID=58172 RepID=UPI0028116399|nr:DUF58 domain-containing protein [Paenibacillus sp.]